MKLKELYISVCLILIFMFPSPSFGLMKETHESINEEVAASSVSNFSFDGYLKNVLGFTGGVNELIYGYSDKEKMYVMQEAYIWLVEGGFMEDVPGGPDKLATNTARANNHFHNPLKHWSEAGLN